MKRIFDSGKAGEQKAVEFLKRNGYRILERNFSSRFGEIDIIAKDDRYIVFVEVKTRKCGALVSGREYVTFSKQHKIRTTSQLWLQSHRLDFLQPRFDVIEIEYNEKEGHFLTERIEHIKDAFC